MGCLNDIMCGTRVIIGIRDFSECNKPESNLFINELPGITLSNAAMVANEEVKSGYDELKRIIGLSTKMVFDEFAMEISPYFNFDAVIQTRELKEFSGSFLPVSANQRGLIIKRFRSELAEIYVEEIYFKCNLTGNVIVDLVDGVKTFHYTVAAIAGQIVTLRTDYRAKSESITLLCDNTSIEVYNGNMSNNAGGCGKCGGSNNNSSGLYIAGWDGSAEQSKYYGVGVKASIRCYEDNVLCSLLPRMYFLLWYKAGILFCNELIHSTRMNKICTFGKDKAEKLRDELMVDYDEKYKIFVKNIYGYLKTTKNDCLTCNGNTYVQALP